MIRTAALGTKAIMRAASANNVKRVVITSSLLAIKGKLDKTQVHFTAQDWTDPQIEDAHYQIKTMAEKAAWDFEDKKIQVVSINPGLIVGPNINGGRFSSGDFVKRLMMGE